jgi:glycosyltransferase involved in cell wall biosynthesis
MKRLKILLISDYFPPYSIGGAEISAYYLGAGLSKLGHDISVLTRYPKKVNSEFKAFGTVHSVVYNKDEKGPYYRMHSEISSSKDIAKKLEYLVKTEDFDVVHAQNWISGHSVMRAKQHFEGFPPSVLSIRDYRYLCPCLYAWCISDKTKTDCNLFKTMTCIYRYSKAPYVTKTLGLIPYALLRSVSCKMLAQSLNVFDAYITNSDFLRRVAINNLGLKAKNVYTAYNPVNLETFNLSSGAEKKSDCIVNILYAGRFDLGKGIEYLIEAIPSIVKNHDNCSFVFVGDGPIRPHTEKLAKKLGVSKHIIFEGFVPYSSISKYYQQCDIVVVPSVWHEPFGRSVIEAMACGKPVVATKVGGIPELVKENETGLLVEPASSEELAKGLIALICDEKLRVRMGMMGRRVAKEKYNTEVSAGNVLRVYENILARGRLYGD